MYDNLRKLKVGSKYTIAGFTYMGTPYNAQFILRSIRCIGFQDGADTYEILYKKVDTKALVCFNLNIRKQFIIWEGLVDPNTNLQVSSHIKDNDSGHVQVLKKWRRDDSRYMHRAKSSVVQIPIVENFQKITSDGRTFDLCEVIS